MAKREDNKPQREEKDDLIRKLVSINRVTKVVKGGRHMRFSALVVVGDGKGKVGIGTGKAGEVPEAIEKAVAQARRDMMEIKLVGTTIPHKVIGKYSRGSVLMLPAEDGAGVIAGGPVRAVMEACGIKNIRTKSHGSNNPYNCVRATMQGLVALKDVETVARLRGKTVEEILN